MSFSLHPPLDSPAFACKFGASAGISTHSMLSRGKVEANVTKDSSSTTRLCAQSSCIIHHQQNEYVSPLHRMEWHMHRVLGSSAQSLGLTEHRKQSATQSQQRDVDLQVRHLSHTLPEVGTDIAAMTDIFNEDLCNSAKELLESNIQGNALCTFPFKSVHFLAFPSGELSSELCIAALDLTTNDAIRVQSRFDIKSRILQIFSRSLPHSVQLFVRCAHQVLVFQVLFITGLSREQTANHQLHVQLLQSFRVGDFDVINQLNPALRLPRQIGRLADCMLVQSSLDDYTLVCLSEFRFCILIGSNGHRSMIELPLEGTDSSIDLSTSTICDPDQLSVAESQRCNQKSWGKLLQCFGNENAFLVVSRHSIATVTHSVHCKINSQVDQVFGTNQQQSDWSNELLQGSNQIAATSPLSTSVQHDLSCTVRITPRWLLPSEDENRQISESIFGAKIHATHSNLIYFSTDRHVILVDQRSIHTPLARWLHSPLSTLAELPSSVPESDPARILIDIPSFEEQPQAISTSSVPVSNTNSKHILFSVGSIGAQVKAFRMSFETPAACAPHNVPLSLSDTDDRIDAANITNILSDRQPTQNLAPLLASRPQVLTSFQQYLKQQNPLINLQDALLKSKQDCLYLSHVLTGFACIPFDKCVAVLQLSSSGLILRHDYSFGTLNQSNSDVPDDLYVFEDSVHDESGISTLYRPAPKQDERFPTRIENASIMHAYLHGASLEQCQSIASAQLSLLPSSALPDSSELPVDTPSRFRNRRTLMNPLRSRLPMPAHQAIAQWNADCANSDHLVAESKSEFKFPDSDDEPSSKRRKVDQPTVQPHSAPAAADAIQLPGDDRPCRSDQESFERAKKLIIHLSKPESADAFLEYLDTPRSFVDLLRFTHTTFTNVIVNRSVLAMTLTRLCEVPALSTEPAAPSMQLLASTLPKPFAVHTHCINAQRGEWRPYIPMPSQPQSSASTSDQSTDVFDCGCNQKTMFPCDCKWCGVMTCRLFYSMPTVLNCTLVKGVAQSNGSTSSQPPSSQPLSQLSQRTLPSTPHNTQSSQPSMFSQSQPSQSLSTNIDALLFALNGGDLDELEQKPVELSTEERSRAFIDELGAKWAQLEQDFAAGRYRSAIAVQEEGTVESGEVDEHPEEDDDRAVDLYD